MVPVAEEEEEEEKLRQKDAEDAEENEFRSLTRIYAQSADYADVTLSCLMREIRVHPCKSAASLFLAFAS